MGDGSLQAQWFCLFQPQWPSSLKPTVTGGLFLSNRAAAGFSCLLPPFWAGGRLTLDFGVVPPFPPALFFQMLLGDRRAVLVSGPPKPCPRPGAHPVPQHLAVTLLCATAPSGHPTPLSPGLQRGDSQNHCCDTEVLEEQGDWTPSPDLPRHCPELGCSSRPACACLRERWLR